MEVYVRVWDPKRKTFNKNPVAVSNDGVISFQNDRWIDTSFVPQISLGLKDRDGIPVFPGDIVLRDNLVLYETLKEEVTHVVEKGLKEYGVVKFDGVKYYTDNHMIVLGYNKDIKIVANIYENPHFIKQDLKREIKETQWVGNPSNVIKGGAIHE